MSGWFPGSEIARWIALGVLGGLAWPAVEYAIHGLLAHRWRTFVSPMHWGHHRNPRAVFTSPLAWIPAASGVGAVLGWVVGPAEAGAFMFGLLVGFFRYEYVHWRIHFRAPRNARERRRWAHHHAHHFVNPRAYHGVTTRFWDRVLGTLPATWRDDYASMKGQVPLVGPSNFFELLNLRVLWARARPTRGRGSPTP